MSTDKENPKNGDMEVEDGSSEETPDTPESKSVTETKDSQDLGRSKEKDSVKKKVKGKDVKKDEVSSDSKVEKKDKDDSESDEDDDDDDNEDDGKVPLLDQPLELSGTRERKKVLRFTEEYKSVGKVPIEIPEGKGMALGTIGKIEANLQKMKPADIKPLHKLLFNRAGKSQEVKKFVKKFNGFDFDEKSEQYTKKKQVLLKLEMKVLKGICTILNLKKTAKREEVVELILNFLMKPEVIDKPVKQPKKRGSQTNKNHSESDEEEKKPQPRKGKVKRANIKEVPSDEDLDDQKEDKGSDEESEVSKKERKRKDSDKEAKENNEDHEDEEEEDATSDDSEEPKSKRGKGGRSEKNSKAPAKKANSKKPTPKKVEKKPAPKKRAKSEDEDEDESSEDEPITKKAKSPPTDEEIKTYVKHILEGANLEETTMKIVCRKVYAHYPEFDLAHKKDFIKTTVKSLIST